MVVVGIEVEMVVGGTDVLVEAGKAVVVATGMDGLVGVSAGRDVPQADKIRTRMIAKLTGQFFFMVRAFQSILICVPGSKNINRK